MTTDEILLELLSKLRKWEDSDEEAMTIPRWARRLGVPSVTIYSRIYGLKRTPEEAVRMSMGPRKQRTADLVSSVGGVTMTLQKWARVLGVKWDAMYFRVKRAGLSPDDAVAWYIEKKEIENAR